MFTKRFHDATVSYAYRAIAPDSDLTTGLIISKSLGSSQLSSFVLEIQKLG